ncbi:hypothetical protein MLD38_025052 [Melastoma candidum]|uniref:Uncharacterized protein n=1 Tax=Melastoma candidum TaxID=119954 RepID=A0ACB9NX91_9MYRT|nr:hypothetical protein MLD38_025052 [Melastoma candidum]
MLNIFRGANAFSTLKSRWQRESTLTTGLLNDVPPEIELSGYGRIPSPGSESPSALLNGESLSLEPISDLDLFFERLYSYYCEKGLWCIITKWVVELLSLGFTICFSGFFLLYVDWNGLRNAKCGMDAVESGLKSCDLAKEAFNQHPLTPLTVSKVIIVGYLGIFSTYWVFCFLRFFAQLKDTLKIRHFYYNSLHVTDNELQSMPWATILEKVVRVQSTQKLCIVKYLSAHDIIMRLMRKENYLIGMLNKGVLAFPICQWLPGAGSVAKVHSHRTEHRLMLTKTLEWTLNWCILQSMFDRNYCVKRDFISSPKILKRRLMFVGLSMLLLSPFLVIFMLVYLFLRHAEQFYHHPSTASSRRWSNLSKWIFREYNEVDHLFKHRIISSIAHSSEYLKQFPSPIVSVIAKFISFVSGGFVAVLLIIAFLEESLLEGHIFGRNLLWYAAVFGTITAISRAAIVDEVLVLNPEGTLTLVVQHTHYMPKRWRGKENKEAVRLEFETMFQYTGMMLLEEMTSIFLTPYLLVFVVPKRVEDILQFIADFTVHVEGVGHVCSFSAFDFQNHGNINYGSPLNASRNKRSSQGKMEKSFLSFQSSYPSWEPDSNGKQFMSNLRTFTDQMLRKYEMRRCTDSTNRIVHGIRHIGEHVDQNSVGFRESPFPRHVPGTWHNLSLLWTMDQERWNDRYILDWYYIHQREGTSATRAPVDVESGLLPSLEPQLGDYGRPPSLFGIAEERNDDKNWEDPQRSQLGASSSAPLFRESVFRHHETESTWMRSNTKSHWWARSAPRGDNTQSQASFREPPDFAYQPWNHNYRDDNSERSTEEDQVLDWRINRQPDQTTHMYGLDEAGDVSLHFDNVYYSRPLETLPSDLEHTRFT